MSLRLMSAVISTLPTQNRTDESDKLLKQLLECVQDCQKRYGGKTELATEFDSCVIALCLTLEQVLHHGLRLKPLESQHLSTLKQVSDIVTNSLHIGNENPSFWLFADKLLTKHEQERYTVLKQIWTNVGRSRAWIRSALNERSLERYLHTILSRSDLLKLHYEDWALLCDQEKSCMLPNMAAGLGSILFAISIDKPEFNSNLPQKPESVGVKAEPIIEAPIIDNSKTHSKERKKKKVARQFISFDEDSILSTSVLSSSGSVSSETSSLNGTQSSTSLPKYSKRRVHDKSKGKMERSDKSESTNAKERKLSFENSGSRQKFSLEVPETLTPVSQYEIGELTPVSVEINEHFKTPGMSNENLEAPSDISAIMTAVETKNQEERSKLQNKIESLMKENEILKDQMKKYISAIQMLQRDDAGLQKALDGLQLEEQPDYKTEAKVYERKLVQVAEMHAELMDFNVHLQQHLCHKDTLVDRLKQELESLRGPVPNDELSDDETLGNVNIWIPSAFLTGPGSSSHHVYQIFLRAGSDEWNIYRRYAQFHALHTDLKKLDPTVSTFDFPPKKSIGNKDSGLVEERRKRLQIYLRRILAHWPELSHCSSRFLLEQHLTFFKDQKELDLTNKKNMVPPRSGGDSNNYTGL